MMMMTMMKKIALLMVLMFSHSGCHALADENTTVYSMGYIWRNTTEKAKAAVVKPDLSEEWSAELRLAQKGRADTNSNAGPLWFVLGLLRR